MLNLLIQNIRVIDPYTDRDYLTDILIENGKIIKIETNINADIEKLNGENLILTSGLIDMHVHLRDPGFTHKETVETGTMSGAAGGFTALCPMPNTNPITDNVETVEYIKSRKSYCKIYPVGAITKQENGEELTDFKELINAGVVAFSDDGKPVENSKLLSEAIKKSKEENTLIISHCEDMEIIKGGIINKGEISKKLNVEGMDRLSEDSITQREIDLAEANDYKIHIAHVSTKGSTEIIRNAKKRGVKVTSETCPHYFVFTDNCLLTKDADYRMNPPLRENEDKQAIIIGLQDGTIDAIVTDHAPHTELEKRDFLTAPNGVVGLETSLSAGITFLVENQILSMNELIKKMTKVPYEIIGVTPNKIRVGDVADFTIYNPKTKWVVEKEKLKSKSKNSIFKNHTLTGKVLMTVCSGETTFREGI